MLGAEMLPLFFQILQQFTKPQHLILCEQNSVRTAGENACQCSWMSSLYSINFWMVVCSLPTLKVQRVTTAQKCPKQNPKQTNKKANTTTPLQSANKQTNKNPTTQTPKINPKGIQ